MNNFADIFKKGFIQETGSLSVDIFLMSMITAFLCAMVIYVIYRYFYKGVVYNNNFNILIVMTTLVTCFIVIVISSNVVLSLGMVGALSIVRYRTAVKDPLDVGFLFWAVAVGVTSGAGLYIISYMATLFVGVIYILLVKIRNKKKIYLFIVKYYDEASDEVLKEISSITKVLKNRTSSKGVTELTYEIKLRGENTSFIKKISEIDGVQNATVVEFTGDYLE